MLKIHRQRGFHNTIKQHASSQYLADTRLCRSSKPDVNSSKIMFSSWTLQSKVPVMQCVSEECCNLCPDLWSCMHIKMFLNICLWGCNSEIWNFLTAWLKWLTLSFTATAMCLKSVTKRDYWQLGLVSTNRFVSSKLEGLDRK